jgi:hypothetical protein
MTRHFKSDPVSIGGTVYADTAAVCARLQVNNDLLMGHEKCYPATDN